MGRRMEYFCMYSMSIRRKGRIIIVSLLLKVSAGGAASGAGAAVVEVMRG